MKKSFGAKTLVFPTPVWVVGTYDRVGKPNVMTAAWGGVCCSSPPCVAVSLRKATCTYGNIVERKAFTISVPSEAYAREADYIGVHVRRSNWVVWNIGPDTSEIPANSVPGTVIP